MNINLFNRRTFASRCNSYLRAAPGSSVVVGRCIAALVGVLTVVGCQTANPGETERCSTPLSDRVACTEPVYPSAVVAADHHVASNAGLRMLELGGNAVDAAVATSFTLSVVRPYSCGIGGGGFMVIYIPADDDDESPTAVALNYRETAPAGVGPDYYVDLDKPLRGAASRAGPHAIGTPGTVSGLLYALDRFGTLDRRTVLEPAIQAAENGFAADDDYIRAIRDLDRRLAAHPQPPEVEAYLRSTYTLDGTVKHGDVIRQPAKARALRLIANEGAAAFYHGPIGEAIVRVVQEYGGALTMDDLVSYQPVVTQPLRSTFADYDIMTMPPPSSGGVAMQQIFGLIERNRQHIEQVDSQNGLQPISPTDPSYLHVVIEAMKHAFADRAEHLADDAFVDVPVAHLVSDEYLDELAGRFDPSRTLERFDYGSAIPDEAESDSEIDLSGGTSHFSVVDGSGTAVACTETVNLRFGSLMVVPEFGIVLNNEMDDFTTIPGAPNAFGLRQSDRNVPEPGKRPLSSMSPTIVLKNGRVFAVAGASGGPRIITATTQVLLRCMIFDEDATSAVNAPRFHHQWVPEELFIENKWQASSGGAEAILELERRGHRLRRESTLGVVQLIRSDEGGWQAASDPRKGGMPAGK